jgi:hypothetical protein
VFSESAPVTITPALHTAVALNVTLLGHLRLTLFDFMLCTRTAKETLSQLENVVRVSSQRSGIAKAPAAAAAAVPHPVLAGGAVPQQTPAVPRAILAEVVAPQGFFSD